MNAAAVASPPPTAPKPDRDVVHELADVSRETRSIVTLLICARGIEHLGRVAEPQFTRDERGNITGVQVVAVPVADENVLLGRRAR